MTATVLAVQKLVAGAGLKPTMVACDAVNHNAIPNNGAQFLLIQNSDSGDHTGTFAVYPKGNEPIGLAVSPLVITVAHGTIPTLVGPLPPSIFNENGVADVAWSSATGMTCALVQFVPNPG